MIFILHHGFLKTTADKSPVNMEPKGSTSRNEPVTDMLENHETDIGRLPA